MWQSFNLRDDPVIGLSHLLEALYLDSAQPT